ncbi:transcriptional regulator, LacI family [Mariniphaga anaerophila]|uniref:Transcriptional regulator, LacI family n=1 Tax=Mariniphaga anaerophila TaxID=1484053 RepID=A0A1M5BQ45_9BACT|nr:LacI family DNA-binding transcriptional regulator [Mariniphaga anaerophila]SHF44723.1 transcriptional regulator, LacI family [Mariniphaga anaerophila]
MKKGFTTIKDIARELKVSPSTVSRALKNHPDISEDTKRAVNELAEKLNYQPNAVALSLKRQRSNTIGVIIPEIVHYFFSSVISGIEDVAYEASFNVIICQSNEMADREKANIKTLLANQVDGILVSVSKATKDFSHLEKIKNSEVPLVFYDRIIPGFKADQVIIDDFDASYRATKHLIDIGKKRIAHFAGPKNLLIGQHRKQGYQKALEDAGLPVEEELVFDADSFEKARLAVLKVLESGIAIDGLFAVNDLTAIGAMQTLQKKGIKIPQEVAVVGFSDGRFSGITDPTLTSVDQHGYEMGTVATQLLLKRIHSKEDYPCETKVLNANLIIRGSSVFSP